MKRVRSFIARALRWAAKFFDPVAPKKPEKPWVQLALDDETYVLWDAVRSRTMTSIERVDALRKAVEYVCANSIPGDIVECGVWRGGSIMAVALTLMRIGNVRKLWLYDTFSGMTPPGPNDIDFQNRTAENLMAGENPETSLFWAKSSLSDVQDAMATTGYPTNQIEYVVGPVETNIPQKVPDKIALLRLDTDWYELTYHELCHLWPRLAVGGILIIDDYGDWAGAKKAVDQYFSESGLNPYLHRVDGTARLIIKIKSEE